MSTIQPLPKSPWPVWQNDTEFALFFEYVQAREPMRILEIGAFYGGTLWYWSQLEITPVLVVSVDLPVHETNEHHAEVWRCRGEWADHFERAAIRFVDHIGRSDDWFIHEQVREDGPYDFIFIDGDHSYEGVKRDFALYLPTLATNGVIALHDTRRHEPGVIQFSEEIRELYPSVQFFSPDWGAGITLVFP